MIKENTYTSPLIEELLMEISPEEQERTEKRMLLAARIDDAIKAKGWKRKDLAKALGKTDSEISKWLSGTHNFTSDKLFDLERVLNVKLITLDNRPQEIIKTYVLNVTAQSTPKPLYNSGSMIYGKGLKQLYKGKSQLNSASNFKAFALSSVQYLFRNCLSL